MGAVQSCDRIIAGNTAEYHDTLSQSFSLCISCTPGKTLTGRKDTQNESSGDGDNETVDQ